LICYSIERISFLLRKPNDGTGEAEIWITFSILHRILNLWGIWFLSQPLNLENGFPEGLFSHNRSSRKDAYGFIVDIRIAMMKGLFCIFLVFSTFFLLVNHRVFREVGGVVVGGLIIKGVWQVRSREFLSGFFSFRWREGHPYVFGTIKEKVGSPTPWWTNRLKVIGLLIAGGWILDLVLTLGFWLTPKGPGLVDRCLIGNFQYLSKCITMGGKFHQYLWKADIFPVSCLVQGSFFPRKPRFNKSKRLFLLFLGISYDLFPFWYVAFFLDDFCPSSYVEFWHRIIFYFPIPVSYLSCRLR